MLTSLSQKLSSLTKRFSYLFSYLLLPLLFLLPLLYLLATYSSPPTFRTPTADAIIATAVDSIGSRPSDPFADLLPAFDRWDAEVGCAKFREKFKGWKVNASAVQGGAVECDKLVLGHVSVAVTWVTWVPDILDGLYSCSCGLNCLWSRNRALVDKADVWLSETIPPPKTRSQGEPLRAFMDLEATRRPSGYEDIFIGYHANDDIQATYAGKTFRITRSYHVSPHKRNDTLVYWSSSRCVPHRDFLAKSFLSLLPHHSFGRCLNNVGGSDAALLFYPDCAMPENPIPHWWDHLHCAMSHYKFVLAIENTKTQSYVTEKLFYALEAGSVPIYFGAPDVADFVPPNSIIDGSKFGSLEELAAYVKKVAEDPVAYAEFHAWRRCGVMGNYGRVRLASLDTLPCRLCELVSRKGGRNAPT
ncbi:alpha-(1,4)-fucosyltransferase-like [Typha angustifolia]|uniref:alpha-(1,4)-fucosyltransferase-like n=1 Tax=Typha angustifolia TaxID=59011 RepID=UPI003C2FCD94